MHFSVDKLASMGESNLKCKYAMLGSELAVMRGVMVEVCKTMKCENKMNMKLFLNKSHRTRIRGCPVKLVGDKFKPNKRECFLHSA